MADEKPLKPNESTTCGGVADQIGGCGPLGTDQAEKSDPDDFEERAAIAEYDSELPREEAETLARQGADSGPT